MIVAVQEKAVEDLQLLLDEKIYNYYLPGSTRVKLWKTRDKTLNRSPGIIPSETSPWLNDGKR